MGRRCRRPVGRVSGGDVSALRRVGGGRGTRGRLLLVRRYTLPAVTRLTWRQVGVARPPGGHHFTVRRRSGGGGAEGTQARARVLRAARPLRLERTDGNTVSEHTDRPGNRVSIVRTQTRLGNRVSKHTDEPGNRVSKHTDRPGNGAKTC